MAQHHAFSLRQLPFSCVPVVQPASVAQLDLEAPGSLPCAGEVVTALLSMHSMVHAQPRHASCGRPPHPAWEGNADLLVVLATNTAAGCSSRPDAGSAGAPCTHDDWPAEQPCHLADHGKTCQPCQGQPSQADVGQNPATHPVVHAAQPGLAEDAVPAGSPCMGDRDACVHSCFIPTTSSAAVTR